MGSSLHPKHHVAEHLYGPLDDIATRQRTGNVGCGLYIVSFNGHQKTTPNYKLLQVVLFPARSVALSINVIFICLPYYGHVVYLIHPTQLGDDHVGNGVSHSIETRPYYYTQWRLKSPN